MNLLSSKIEGQVTSTDVPVPDLTTRLAGLRGQINKYLNSGTLILMQAKSIRNMLEIEKALSSQHAVIITRYGKEAGVMLSPERYRNVMDMLQSSQELLAVSAQQQLQAGVDDFDTLFARIATQDTAAGVNAMSGMSDADLANSFRPGSTEQMG
jgi:PHD/YefM family antitoxin component YafN of YafNO toxin-antitoxin module